MSGLASTIVHISDLHLRPNDDSKAATLRALEAALAEHVNESSGRRASLVIVSGDVFDSSDMTWDVAGPLFDQFMKAIDGSLGRQVPVVVVPGNHDRRASGVFGEHDTELFRALHAAHGGERIKVTGIAQHSLVELLDDIPALAARLASFDSTYLPRGLVGAGGWLRPQDLLHLPTPLTDVGAIDVAGRPAWQRFLIARVLPWLVANGDREELTMTALGAGSALSLLHALGRPVLVLHVHKHYPTVRLLKGLAQYEGDLLLVAAGSAGTWEPWRPFVHEDVMRLWPSFNLIEISSDGIDIESVSYSPRDDRTPFGLRPLVAVKREGSRWNVRHDAERARSGALRLAENMASFALAASPTNPGDAFDITCTRRITPHPQGAFEGKYSELIEGLRDGDVSVDGDPSQQRQRLPKSLDLPLGRDLTYQVRRGACRTLEAARRELGPGNVHESVELVNRYGCSRVRLTLDVGDQADHVGSVFGSVTDLETGRERPARVQRHGQSYVIEEVDCEPRTLVRIYWSLCR
jgi:Calcineurin-like phosphoesterase